MLDKIKVKVTIPGILFIDTPGHAAFNNLRKRGGSLADIAVLVIDINEGIKPQTIESIEILKNYKVPFIIAANKIDLLPGWKSSKNNLIENIKNQNENVKNLLDNKIYEIVGKLFNKGFNAERFDKVEDYTKQIGIIPLSARTGEGIQEALMTITGLTQKYLENNLKINVKGSGKGTILEIKEEKGLGIVLDTIIYDGSLNVDDTIVIGAIDEPIVTKVRALFVQEFKERNVEFRSVKSVTAASSVKISCPNIENAISGMPLIVAKDNVEKIKENIKREIEEVLIETDNEGIVVKADSLGSLEALIGLLKEKNIEIKRASIGEISKKDIIDAGSEKNELNKVILGFNIKKIEANIKIICNNIIYKIIEDFESWKEEEIKKIEARQLEGITKPCKLEFLKKHTFRQSNPAVIGIEVLEGTLTTKINLMKKDGSNIGEVKEIQSENKSVNSVKKGEQVAISLPKVTVGRQIKENDIFYSDIKDEEFRKLKELKKYLNNSEIQALKEIAEIKRKFNAMWGI